MTNPQLIAFYFPQFHAIPENDVWWGKGFSDWQLVKSNKPLFKGHNQPRAPIDGDYYDPCNYDTLKKQIELAKKFSVGGFMMYHYWFDSKLLLERPLEVFLNHKDLNFPFCICWANESWTRSWVGHPERFLIRQTHTPDVNLWRKHFDYLLPFFKDHRAIRVGGKIVFVIYQPSIITKGTEMIKMWRQWAKDEGIGELYVIGVKGHHVYNPKVFDGYDGVLKFQPRLASTSAEFASSNFTNRFSFLRKLPERMISIISSVYIKGKRYSLYDSFQIWNIILNKAYHEEFNNSKLDVFESAYFEWDNSPRYGKKAKIYTRIPNAELENNLRTLKEKAIEHKSPLIFFNAWNEWSESAYLEPDVLDRYDKLEIVHRIFDNSISVTKEDV